MAGVWEIKQIAKYQEDCDFGVTLKPKMAVEYLITLYATHVRIINLSACLHIPFVSQEAVKFTESFECSLVFGI